MHIPVDAISLVLSLSHYKFNPFAVPGFISGFLVLALGASIFIQKKNSAVNISFLIVCLSVWWWLFGISMMFLSVSAELAALWYTWAFISVLFIPPNVFTFTVNFLEKFKHYKRLILIGYAQAVFFGIVYFSSGYFLLGMIRYKWGWYPHFGLQSIPFLVVWCAFFLATSWLFISALNSEKDNVKRLQIKYVHLGYLIGYVGVCDFIPAFQINSYPFGYIPIFCFAAILTYAIKKHRLLIITPEMAAETIINTMADALIVFNKEGMILSGNPVTVSLFGYTVAELTGKNIKDIFMEKYIFSDQMKRSFVMGDAAHGYEVTGITKSGGTIPVSLSVALVKNRSGDMAGFVGIARDVRDTKRIIEELKLKTAETERELSERIKAETALQEAYERLQSMQAQLLQSAKLAAVGQLAAGVAHEINNPLCVIRGFAQSLNRDMKPDDPLAIPLKNIEREVTRCGNLVRDLLTFSRVNNDHEMKKCDINEVIRCALALVEAETKYKSVELEKELGDGLPKVAINRNQIQQVMINLCSNAIDAMSGKGTLTVRSLLVEGNVEIQVTDTGAGIPEEIQSRIFEPFFTTKQVGEGTGLGLSLVYEIMNKHKGRIEFATQIGKGTTFRVIFSCNP